VKRAFSLYFLLCKIPSVKAHYDDHHPRL